MTDEELDAKVIAGTNTNLADRKPYVGMKVRHVKSGGDYRVECLARVEATQQPVVVYRSLAHDDVWTRPLEEFCDGRFVGI